MPLFNQLDTNKSSGSYYFRGKNLSQKHTLWTFSIFEPQGEKNTLISLTFHMANVLYTFLIAVLTGICQPIVTGTQLAARSSWCTITISLAAILWTLLLYWGELINVCITCNVSSVSKDCTTLTQYYEQIKTVHRSFWFFISLSCKSSKIREIENIGRKTLSTC